MRTTININDEVLRAIKLRSAESDTPVSELIEEALVAQLLEDAEDIEDAARRASEPVLPFAELVKKFEASGVL